MATDEAGQRHSYHDGHVALAGELYPPSSPANGHAILVVHEADGIGGNVRRHCRMLADLGYFAMAADMHGYGEPLTGDAMQRALDDFRQDPDLIRGRVAAGFNALLAVTGMSADHSAAVGFCFGGYAALELARSGSSVAAVASFHGLLTTARAAQPGEVAAAMVVFTGARDPLAPAKDVAAFEQEMTAAGADWQLTSYGNALHSFTNRDVDRMGDPRMAYDPIAHHLSWNAALDFLEAKLGKEEHP